MHENENEFKDLGFNIKIWRRLLPYAFRNKKIAWFAGLSVALCSVVDLAYSLMSKLAVDNYVTTGNMSGFAVYVIGYLLLILIQGLSIALFVIYGNRTEITVNYHLRQDMFYRLQKLSFSYYDRTSVGHIMARLTSDVSNIGEILVWSMIHVVMCGVYVIGIIVVMFILDWQLALLEMILIPILVWVCDFFGKRMLIHQRKVRAHNSNITGAYNECIMGAQTTKTLVREEQNEREFTEETAKMKKASMRYATVQFIFMPLITVLGSLGTAIALYKGGADVLGGRLSFGSLTVFISSMAMLFESLELVAESYADLQSTQASAERVLQLLDTPIEIQDSAEAVEKYGDSFSPKRENFPEIRGDIEFSHVSFRYKDGEDVLHDFNLSVKSGQTIALVGETGAGKSTIVNLLCRFYEPTSGQILIDGVDYRERSQVWLQSNLGYVLQQPHLFSGTIRENISFGKRDATDEEIIRAAKLSHAYEFISTLPKGFNTETGEGGMLLSTGQKQLVSFARVIAANPKIFVLDEATSSIDTETEQLIQSAITNVLQGRTSFIVAHRLSTIRNADRILVIHDGMITEDGTHDELMQKKGSYYELYTNQFRDESI